MDEGKGWFRANWRTAVVLAVVFGIALFLRFYFVYGLAFPAGIYTGGGDYSGGSDSFYWERAVRYTFQTGKDLGWDVTLNYPVGLYNPRPPLFPWFAVLMGRIVAPLFGDPWHAIVFVFLSESGLFGALTVFPTYLLTKEAFGRRAGLVAAFLLAISAAHLQRSQATDADHDAFTLFFVVSTFYFYLRALKVLKPRRWVDNWFQRGSILVGVRAFLHENPKSILYAALSGLCITAIALAWQGWAYVPVILLVLFVVELFLDRLRNQDTMAVTFLFSIVMLVPLVLALPWYVGRVQIRVWFDVPGYLFLAALVLGAAFTVTRDYPWTLVVPSTILAGGAGLGVGLLVNPALANAFVSGAGYFVQTKVVSTIAEAQAPGLSQLILSFGWFTFFFGLAAVAFMLWQIPRRHDPAYTMIAIWAFASIFMALSAARFIFSGSPAFAVAASYAIDQILIRADFAGMRRSYRSLADGSWRNAIRKSVKLRHVATVLLLAIVVLLPNVWFGVDAAIPYELKPAYDRQVNELLPSFLRAPGFEAQSSGRGSFYFGAFGYALPQATESYPAAWRWLATQDAETPLEERPAFLSWWDYGFEAVDRGAHPTVADNFQDGIPIAGLFITAQGEAQGISLLALRLIQGDARNHGGTFSPKVKAALSAYGLSPSEILGVLKNGPSFAKIITDNPQTYGSWDLNMGGENAFYIYLAHVLTTRLNTNRIVELYRDLREATGYDIGYFAVDSRLFPISATNTGIFYAPVKLSDHRVTQMPDGRVLPFEFFQIFVDTNRATHLPLQSVPPGDQITSETIEYQPMFYNSMFYRAYIGYSPSDLGSTDKGIPGFSQNLRDSPPDPAWNLSHFRVVYRTAYYNPFPDPSNHTDAWRAVNYADAIQLQKDIGAGKAKGFVDLSTQAAVSNGVVFLRYYDGAWVNGTVTSGGITPLPGVRITVQDELGTPHYVTTTDAEGRYSTLVPFGDVTVTASIGNVSRRTLLGATILASATFSVTIDQALRVNEDLNGDGVLDWIMTRNLDAAGRMLRGTAYFDLNQDGAFDAGDSILPGATVELSSKDLPLTRTLTTGSDGTFSAGPLPDGTYKVKVTASRRTIDAPDLPISTSTEPREDLKVPFTWALGFAKDLDSASVVGAKIQARDETNGTVLDATAGDAGQFEFAPLLAGNYTITGESGSLGAFPVRLRATSGTAWANLTLVPSGHVVGKTRLFGTEAPLATLDFQSAGQPLYVRTLTSDASAAFDVTLPVGEWNVNGRLYAGGSVYATLGRVSVTAGTTTSYDAIFVDGARVNGTVSTSTNPNTPARAEVAFITAAAEWRVRSGADGTYLAFLPVGTYAVQASGASTAFFGNVRFASSRRLDVSLAPATSMTGSVFRDVNGNGLVDPKEGIFEARLTLTDDLGRKVLAVTNESGAFTFVGFSNRTLVGTITARGYQDRPLPSFTLDDLRIGSPYALVPLRVPVRGSVLLDGSPLLLRATAVQARAIGVGSDVTTTTDSNGGFTLSLLPGTYELVVDENVSSTPDWRYQNLGTDRIAVAVGDLEVAQDLAIVARVRVTGNVTIGGNSSVAAISFVGPDSVSLDATYSGFTAYMQPGTYSVSASGTSASDTYATLETRTITSPANLTFALVRATLATGHTTYSGTDVAKVIPISFVHEEGGSLAAESNALGAYAAFLVPGTYRVAVDFATDEIQASVTQFVRYTANASLTVPANETALSYDIVLARSLDNTTVLGNVTWSGSGADASLSFLARGGGAITANTTSAIDGSYSIGLAPGTYDVYATRALGSAAYLNSLTVGHAPSRFLDISLRPGYSLSGVVTNPSGARTVASVTIQAGAKVQLTTDPFGAYDALLPAGTYAVSASVAGVEQGVDVRYEASASVDLTADLVANLPLEKVVEHSASLSWDASQRRTLAGGASITYAIQVTNTGNVPDTFTFSGRTTGWTFTFVPSTVSLDFGNTGNRTSLQVTIQTPADALVQHGAVVLSAATPDGQTRGTVEVKVDIARVRGIALSVDAGSATFDGRYLNYTLSVTNRGNDGENVTVLVSNPDDLAAQGWSAKLGKGSGPATGLQVTGVAVLANATSHVRVQVQSLGGASGASVVLQAFPNDAPGVSSTVVQPLALPSLGEIGGIRVGGPLVSREPPLNVQLVAVLSASMSAIAAGLFLTRRRR